MRAHTVIAVCLALCALLASVQAVAQVDSVSQEFIHFHGRDVIYVYGSGFRTHGSVVCEWFHEYQSSESEIVDDNTIRCQSPRVLRESVEEVPFFGEFNIYFDGNKKKHAHLVSENFRIGPGFTGFQPSGGFVRGGEWFIVRGTGFDDFSSADIYFDGVLCPQGESASGELQPIIEGDGELRCRVPKGEFAQDAVIDVEFEKNPLFRYRLDGAYQYGPRLNEVVPGCSLLRGGTRVTLKGDRMGDPATRESSLPPRVELIVGPEGDRTRFFGINVTINDADASVSFFTPDLGNELVYGIRPLIQLFYGRDSNAVTIDSLVYGPVVYDGVDLTGASVQNPSPFYQHIGGGDVMRVFGCGLESLGSAADVHVFVNNGTGAAVELCDRGVGPGLENDTLSIVSNGDDLNLDYFECTTRQIRRVCSAPQEEDVSVSFENLDVPVGQPRAFDAVIGSVSLGPVVNSVLPTRGPRVGGQKVTITGSAFLHSGAQGETDWAQPLVHFRSGAHELAAAEPLVFADDHIVVLTPEGKFGLDTDVQVDFSTDPASLCAAQEPDGGLNYHFGPVCTLVTPSHGPLTGQAPVTVFGEGFTEEGATILDTEVRFCIQRLNPDDTLNCRAFEESKTTLVTDSRIESETPSDRQHVVTAVGSNRLFGDVADVFVHFLTAGTDRDFNRALLADGLDVAAVKCSGSYEFGPIVESFSPQTAPNGPYRAESNKQVRGPPVVTIHGDNFDEAFYQSPPLVSFGSTLGQTVSVDDNAVSTEPLPGHASNSDVDLVMTFAPTCNLTSSGQWVSWGPAFDSVWIDGLPSRWGAVAAPNRTVVISGSGFEEYIVDDELIARCVIDGEVVWTKYEDGLLYCALPALPFGTSFEVGVEFGTDCNSPSSPIDWRNVVTWDEHFFATAAIDSIYPSWGHARGNTPVNITGAGFSGFSSAECVFGGYATPAFIVSDSLVTCATPRTRGEFNTDVSVSLVFDGKASWKLCSRDLVFHYGPVCSSIAPASCDTTGCSAAVVGSGFQDCFVSDVEPLKNCVFRQYLVEMVHPVTGEVTVLDAPTNDTHAEVNSDTALRFDIPALDFCGVSPLFRLRFPDAAVSTAGDEQRIVQCVASEEDEASPFSVGPVFFSQTSELQDEDGMSFGWEGDVISISGAHFTHASSLVECVFTEDGTLVETTSVAQVRSDSLLECVMPKNAFDTYATLSVRWHGVPQCDMQAGRVHYGPVLYDSSPARGYVEARTTITVSGFGFGCCGMRSVECLLPNGEVQQSGAGPTVDQVTCVTPQNNTIDQLITNIGLRFSSLRFTESPRNEEDLVRTQWDTALQFFYGPVVHDISPARVSLSARDERITITGEGFADPYFTDVFCDFHSTTGSADVVGEIKVEIPDKTDTTIVCDVREFARLCGDIDLVRPRWRRTGRSGRPEQGKFYWRTEKPDVPQFDEPTFVDGGSQEDTYAATALSYTPAVISASTLQSEVGGGTEILVHMTNLRDWKADNSDFGPGEAMCVFGDFRSPVVPIHAVQADVPDTVWPSNFTCVTPDAPFGYKAELQVLLNPLQVAVSDDTPFHWSGHALDLSRRWGSTAGREVVVVRGRGFCNYPSATCLFGDVQALQSEITSDHSVTCVTPPHAPAHVPVRVKLCNGHTCDVVTPANVNSDFTFVGVNSFFPQQGPVCGGTRVTAHGFGFKFFDEVRCVFNGHPVIAQALDDNTVTCISPDQSSEFDPDDNNVFCVTFAVFGIRDGDFYRYEAPQTYEYGFPQVTSVSPSTFDIDEAPVRLTISGLYLNGGDAVNGTYRCLFGDVQTKAVILLGENDDDDTDFDTQVLCHTPPRGDLQVGTYTVEVLYECDHNEEYTYNRVPVTVTQDTRVLGLSPQRGAELGGMSVTLTGDDFNGGTLYLCAFGDVFTEGGYTAVQGKFTKGLKLPDAPFSPLPSVEGSFSAVDDDDDELSHFRAVATHHHEARAVLNRDDTIVCKVPFKSVKESEFVPVAVSIDGGQSWVHSPDRFLYQNIFAIDDGDVCPNSVFAQTQTKSAGASLLPSVLTFLVVMGLLLLS